MNDNTTNEMNSQTEAVYEQAIENETQNKKEPAFSEILSEDLSNGLRSLLYKRISKVTITDSRIRDAFQQFVREVECAETLSVAEIIYSAEAVVKGRTTNEDAENKIYCYEHIPTISKRLSEKLLKNSVGGIYSLFSLRNGLTLDLAPLGGNFTTAETKRFIVAPEKKANKLISEAARESVNIVPVGSMLANEKILLTSAGGHIATVEKSIITRNGDPVSVTLTPEHYADFRSGYLSVCSLSLCNCVVSNNLIRFGLGGDINSVVARALGYFSAMIYLKTAPIRNIYVPDSGVTVAVPRPMAADGDYLYLLKLRNNQNGLPDKSHYSQLYYYLCEKKRVGIIKDVLPVRENVERVVNRLCTENLEYVSMSSIPEECFGIIVSVRRGESVNGIKLGYFKNIE